MTVDLRTNTAKAWPMLALAGLEEAPECAGAHVPQSCDWYASDVRLDLESGRMYFIAPAAAPGDVLEEGEEDDANRFSVVVAALPEMKLVKKFEIPGAQSEIPTIILTQDGKKLLVSYREQDPKVCNVETFDTKTLQKTSVVKDSSGNVLNTYFPTESYFTPSGKFIVQLFSRIQVDADGFRQGPADPRTNLTADDRKRLAGFFKIEKDGQRLLPFFGAASINGTTLEMVTNDGNTETAWWTMNAETGADSPVVTLKYFAKGELLGRGEQMALFEGRMSSATPAEASQFERTGHVAIYSVHSGALVREFTIPELKGRGELLCSTADGTTAMNQRAKNELLVLDLKAGHVTQVPGEFDSLPQPRYTGACAFEQ